MTRPSIGFTWYSARSATATSSSLVRPSSGKQARPALIVTTGRESGVEPGGRLGARADDAADPFGDLVRDDPVGAGEDGREFVAAVSIEAVAVARGGGHGPRDVHEQGVSRGVAQRVVEALEVVEIEHQHRERRALLDRLSELALERSVVA